MTAADVLLTTAQMAMADRLAVEAGVPSLTLMENAGRAVADAAQRILPPTATVLVLCGPGNNGGDGYVAARLLRDRGHHVDLVTVVPPETLRGDAAIMAQRWSGPTSPPTDVERLPRPALIVDALYGAGLTRPLEGPSRALVAWANASGCPILAVDVPSGIDGTTGEAAGGIAITATETVTFFRLKPGHLLLPGRRHCGCVTLADIGIPDSVLTDIASATVANGRDPSRWAAGLRRDLADHKYTRGHAVVVSGPAHATGAARLAARAALRVGAGLVSLASPRDAVATNAAHLTAIMLAPFDAPRGLAAILTDRRITTVLLGPAAGLGPDTRTMATDALAAGAAVVLDADALTSFAGDLDLLARAIRTASPTPRDVVLTPHDGEYTRLAGKRTGSRLDRARALATASGAVVVLKGPDTVIAAPDGRAAINDNAPPSLGTAGSGDVLAGLVAGLLAQGFTGYDAACAAVWLHGDCASEFGPGLIAEDLPEMLPRVLARLLADSAKSQRNA